MSAPRHDDAASPCQDCGAGSVVIPLHSYRKHSTRRAPAPMQAPKRRVRVFLGSNAHAKAAAWATVHGHDTALVLADDCDPVDVQWPAGALVKVVADHPEPFARLSALARAMRRAGVFYAALPHEPEWPNLWPACWPGDGA